MKFAELIKRDENVIPMYEKLRNDKNAIFMWGTGALARNICQYCTNYGITLTGCFVNRLSEEKEYFESIPIFSLDEVLEEYDDISIIIAHSNYAEGVEFLKNLKKVKKIYCISSICCGVWENISINFLNKNEDILNEIYDNLQDKWSKKCMVSYFESRMNDNASYMFPYFKNDLDYYKNDIIKLTDRETLLDIGACIGAAIWPFINAVEGKYNSIIALEPDHENFEILEKNIKDRNISNILLRKACAYESDGYVRFAGDKEQGGIKEDAESFILYPAVKIDSLCEEIESAKDISIIKINFPFSVPQILDGASHLLKCNKPRIIIRIGFNEDVLVETYTKIKEINPTYQFYFRYSIGIPQGLTMFAL